MTSHFLLFSLSAVTSCDEQIRQQESDPFINEIDRVFDWTVT